MTFWQSRRLYAALGLTGLIGCLFGGLALAKWAGPEWLAVIGVLIAFGGGLGLILWFGRDGG